MGMRQPEWASNCRGQRFGIGGLRARSQPARLDRSLHRPGLIIIPNGNTQVMTRKNASESARKNAPRNSLTIEIHLLRQSNMMPIVLGQNH
jgi:hypothetical protein